MFLICLSVQGVDPVASDCWELRKVSFCSLSTCELAVAGALGG